MYEFRFMIYDSPPCRTPAKNPQAAEIAAVGPFSMPISNRPSEIL
jgi:hypothetical protein